MTMKTSCWLSRVFMVVAVAAGVMSTGCAAKEVKCYGDEQFRPKLFQNLPIEMHEPDGLRLDPRTGDMYVAFPNFTAKENPGVIGKITPDNKLVKVVDMPKHPETGYGCPMGMDFGPDGHLYVADNQYFYNKDHKSSIVRVVMKDGKAVKTEVVVTGFKLSNAVMFRGNDLFVTDTFFDLKDKPGTSGLYRISLDEMNKGIVKLLPKEQAAKDPHCVATWQTIVHKHRLGEVAGADGMTFDSQGNCYVGNFGDGVLRKFTFKADGSLKSADVFVKDFSKMTCVDGIFYDKKRDCIYIADSEKNAIQIVWLPEGKLTTLWENDDTDGTNGLLDQPCEPALRGDQLIISNFDYPFPGLKNTKFDKPYTMSVIDVSGLKRPK